MMKKLLIAVLLFLPTVSFAATATLMLDTLHQSINTLEAMVHVPAGVNIDSVEDGNSLLLIWLSPPTIDNTAHTVTFTGLTPGGFEGVRPVFSLIGDFKESDISSFYVSDVTALQNDGKGTKVNVKLILSAGDAPSDTESPEPFTPIFGQSADILNGQKFISFLTEDKRSGVDHYEYAATWLLKPSTSDWQKVLSPYVVPKGDYSKTLYIRAVDRVGNVRISSIAGPTRTRTLSLWGILLVLLACVLYFRRRFF